MVFDGISHNEKISRSAEIGCIDFVRVFLALSFGNINLTIKMILLFLIAIN
jgi:hypothetical protein